MAMAIASSNDRSVDFRPRLQGVAEGALSRAAGSDGPAHGAIGMARVRGSAASRHGDGWESVRRRCASHRDMKLVYVTLLLALIISLITLEVVTSRLPVELLRP